MNSMIPFEQNWHYKIVVWPIMIFSVVFFVWAAYTEVDEVVRGDGKIIPSGNTKVIQHLEGGIISDILVNEGDVVKHNEVLFRLSQAFFQADSHEKKLELLSYIAKDQRIEAQIKEKDSVQFSKETMKEIPQIAANEKRILTSERNRYKDEFGLLLDEIEKKELELNELRVKQNNLNIELSIAKENLDIQERLVRQGASSKQEYLKQLASKQSLVTQIDSITNRIPIIEEEVQAAQKKRNNFKSKYTSKSLEELNRVRMAINKLLEQNKAITDRESRKEVRSPVNGKINKLYFHTKGGIIKPGDKMVEITPIDEALMIEAKIKTIDRAQIFESQKVSIEVTAYRSSKYGRLEGTLVTISPDSTEEKDGNSYYSVKIKTTQLSFSENEPLLPGMVVNINILTGKKTILEYILKPLKDISHNALVEK